MIGYGDQIAEFWVKVFFGFDGFVRLAIGLKFHTSSSTVKCIYSGISLSIHLKSNYLFQSKRSNKQSTTLDEGASQNGSSMVSMFKIKFTKNQVFIYGIETKISYRRSV